MSETLVKNGNDSLLNATPESQGAAIVLPQPDQKSFDHTQIRGRFNQYTSGFWALAMPALAARYVLRYAEGLFKPELKKLNWNTDKNIYSKWVGSWMLGVVGYYALRTYGDMKHVFSETLAYEFDKKPEDVTARDFFNSKNAIVHRTLWNFIKYNSRRTLVASTFFAFLLGKKWARFKDPDAHTVDLGTGVTGAYLVSDILSRKMTFFEGLQSFIDNKINHADYLGQPITGGDLISLYAIHERDNNPQHKVSNRMDTEAWKNDQIIFGRMADLMNQTYGNEPKKEHADFTIPKFIYLLGQGIVKAEKLEHNLAYIEIANRYGIPAVKEAAAAIKGGAKVEDVLVRFPVTLPCQAPEIQESMTTHVGRLAEQKLKDMGQAEIRLV